MMIILKLGTVTPYSGFLIFLINFCLASVSLVLITFREIH